MPGPRMPRSWKFGCGVDVVELERFQKALQRGGDAFRHRIFTSEEQRYAKARKRTTILHLAGRFAAKEAVLKALSQVHPRRMLAMNKIEVCNDRLGRPSIVVHDRSMKGIQIYVSLSHVNSVAVASAIAIRR